MSYRLSALDKQTDMRPVGVRKTWGRLFTKILIKFTGPEAIMACQYDQLYSGLKARNDGAVHGAHAIWDEVTFLTFGKFCL